MWALGRPPTLLLPRRSVRLGSWATLRVYCGGSTLVTKGTDVVRTFLIFLAIITGFLNLFLQVPLTPVYARSLTTDILLVAFAVSAYSIANLVGNLFAGLVVDRFNQVTVLVGGLILAAAAMVGCGSVSSIQALIPFLMLNGLAISVVTPAAYTLLSQHLSDDERGAGMARSGVTIGLAAMMGPPIAGLLADRLGDPGAYRAIGAFLATMAVVMALFLKRTAQDRSSDVGLSDIWGILGDRRLVLAWVGAFTLMFVNGGLVFALPSYVKGMGHSAAMVGALFSTFALSAIAVFVTPLGNLAKRVGPARALAAGAVLMAVGCGALAVFKPLPALIAVMAVYGVGFGLVFPAALAALVENAPAHARGSAFGVFYAIFSLGGIAAPFALSQAGNLHVSPFLMAAALPVVFSIGLTLCGRRIIPALS